MIPCSVRSHCQTATHCPWCIAGSEYTPDAYHVRHPAALAAHHARQAARRQHRQLPAVQRGAHNRRQGLATERFLARTMHGRVNPGSGRWDQRPNDVYVADWQLESRHRHGQFGQVWRLLASADGIRLTSTIYLVPYATFLVYHPRHPQDSWVLPSSWHWASVPSTIRWTTLLRWIRDPREHPDAVFVRTGIRSDGHDAFVVWSTPHPIRYHHP